MKLLTPPNAQPKTGKSAKLGVLTYALHLAPASLSGRNVCPKATEGCKAACLNTAGRGIFNSVQDARKRRTDWYFTDREGFMRQLAYEIVKASERAAKLGMRLAIRLNATSDIPWERVPVKTWGFDSLMAMFPGVQFYDYTKIAKRMAPGYLPPNYHLTFSLAENNGLEAALVLAVGGNVAAVFRTRAMVETAMRTGMRANGRFYPVIDGDETDARFLDPRGGVVVALYAKGKAKTDQSGFVKDL